MKKTAIILLTAIMCGIIGTGCSDTGQTVDKKEDGVSISQAEKEKENSEDADTEDDENTDSKKDKNNKKSKKSKDKENSASDGAAAGENANEAVPEEVVSDGSNGTYSIDDSDLTDIAVELHNKSCEMQWKFLMRCSYPLDENDVIDNEYIRVEVDSLAVLKAEYCQIFAGDGSELDERYIERDGKVYWRDGGRGGNIFYTGTDLVPVSADETKAVFTAVSHYADPDTREPMDSKSYDFVIIKDKDVWRVSEFTLPN